MKIGNDMYQTIWIHPNDEDIIQVIDQRLLPHKFIVRDLKTVDDFVFSIKEMVVRGAPLIGITAAYGMYIACRSAPEMEIDKWINNAYKKILQTRPTASNLKWALENQLKIINNAISKQEKVAVALNNANRLKEEDISTCKKIGEHGLPIIESISKKKNGKPVNILTHCNAGWLATVDYGTATASIYLAHEQGIAVHVWVDETRPRNQGAALTAYELGQHGIPHTVIADNTGGHLMQHGMVDMCIVGTDRTTRTGDVCNKIGTYLKALAANDNDVPFYVALPSSTIDWEIENGLTIPIEMRNEDEVKYISGLVDEEVKTVLLTPQSSPAANYAFDVTPAKYVTALITERGICKPDELTSIFPERR